MMEISRNFISFHMEGYTEIFSKIVQKTCQENISAGKRQSPQNKKEVMATMGIILCRLPLLFRGSGKDFSVSMRSSSCFFVNFIRPALRISLGLGDTRQTNPIMRPSDLRVRQRSELIHQQEN